MFLWSGSFDRLLSLFAVLCPTYSVLDLFCLVLWPWSYPTSVPGSPLSSVCSLTLAHGLLVRLCFIVLLLWIPVLGLLSSYILVWCWNEVHPFCSPSFVLCSLASVFLSFGLLSFILGAFCLAIIILCLWNYTAIVGSSYIWREWTMSPIRRW